MNNTKTTRHAPHFSGSAGGELQVITDKLELPRGSFFTAIAGAPAQSGDLVMFSIGRRTSVGRWLPDVGGVNWILLPGVLIACVGAPVRIIGKVVVTAHPKVCPSGRIKAGPQSRN